MVGLAKPLKHAGLKSGAGGLELGGQGQQVRRVLQSFLRPAIGELDAAKQILLGPTIGGVQREVSQRLECRFRRAVILEREVRLTQQQVTGGRQLFGGLGARGGLKNPVRRRQQLDYLRPLPQFGPRGRFADGRLQTARRRRELLDQFPKSLSRGLEVIVVEIGLAQPEKVLVCPFAGLALAGGEQLDGASIISKREPRFGLEQYRLGQIRRTRILSREVGKSPFGPIVERVIEGLRRRLKSVLLGRPRNQPALQGRQHSQN